MVILSLPSCQMKGKVWGLVENPRNKWKNKYQLCSKKKKNILILMKQIMIFTPALKSQDLVNPVILQLLQLFPLFDVASYHINEIQFLQLIMILLMEKPGSTAERVAQNIQSTTRISAAFFDFIAAKSQLPDEIEVKLATKTLNQKDLADPNFLAFPKLNIFHLWSALSFFDNLENKRDLLIPSDLLLFTSYEEQLISVFNLFRDINSSSISLTGFSSLFRSLMIFCFISEFDKIISNPPKESQYKPISTGRISSSWQITEEDDPISRADKAKLRESTKNELGVVHSSLRIKDFTQIIFSEICLPEEEFLCEEDFQQFIQMESATFSRQKELQEAIEPCFEKMKGRTAISKFPKVLETLKLMQYLLTKKLENQFQDRFSKAFQDLNQGNGVEESDFVRLMLTHPDSIWRKSVQRFLFCFSTGSELIGAEIQLASSINVVLKMKAEEQRQILAQVDPKKAKSYLNRYVRSIGASIEKVSDHRETEGNAIPICLKEILECLKSVL